MGDQEEAEKPAKQWQVVAIQKELEGLNGKMDQLLKSSRSYVTVEQLRLSKEEQNKYVVDKTNVIEIKYGPIYKMFWVLITAVVLETAVLVLQFAWRG